MGEQKVEQSHKLMVSLQILIHVYIYIYMIDRSIKSNLIHKIVMKEYKQRTEQSGHFFSTQHLISSQAHTYYIHMHVTLPIEFSNSAIAASAVTFLLPQHIPNYK